MKKKKKNNEMFVLNLRYRFNKVFGPLFKKMEPLASQMTRIGKEKNQSRIRIRVSLSDEQKKTKAAQRTAARASKES